MFQPFTSNFGMLNIQIFVSLESRTPLFPFHFLRYKLNQLLRSSTVFRFQIQLLGWRKHLLMVIPEVPRRMAVFRIPTFLDRPNGITAGWWPRLVVCTMMKLKATLQPTRYVFLCVLLEESGLPQWLTRKFSHFRPFMIMLEQLESHYFQEVLTRIVKLSMIDKVANGLFNKSKGWQCS